MTAKKDKIRFGIECVNKPTPKKLKMLGNGIAIFCTTFSITLLSNGYILSGIILTGVGTFLDKALIPFFSSEEDCPTPNTDDDGSPEA